MQLPAPVMGCVLLLACSGGCPAPSGNDAGATNAQPNESICAVEPACAGVQLDDPAFDHGWAMGGDGAPLTLFLSNPGTSCGDQNPKRCTSCGTYESLSVTLPPDAQAPGVYDETQVDLECYSAVYDCNGNGGGEGVDGTPPTYSIEIVSIDADCIVGELLDTPSCSDVGQFAVIRCPS